MNIGIDGNMWYVSNGMCLGDPRSKFRFERTLREAIEGFNSEFKEDVRAPLELGDCLDMTPEDYQQWASDNGQFGVGA